MRATDHTRYRYAQIADHRAHKSPLSALFIKVVCSLVSNHDLTAATWGNHVIRTPTRRRHANSQLLMLPNPHRRQCGGRRRHRKVWWQAGRRDKIRPVHPLPHSTRDKVRPATRLLMLARDKIRPARQKTLILGHFERAGRTFSRSHPRLGRAGRTISRTGRGDVRR